MKTCYLLPGVDSSELQTEPSSPVHEPDDSEELKKLLGPLAEPMEPVVVEPEIELPEVDLDDLVAKEKERKQRRVAQRRLDTL